MNWLNGTKELGIQILINFEHPGCERTNPYRAKAILEVYQEQLCLAVSFKQAVGRCGSR